MRIGLGPDAPTAEGASGKSACDSWPRLAPLSNHRDHAGDQPDDQADRGADPVDGVLRQRDLWHVRRLDPAPDIASAA